MKTMYENILKQKNYKNSNKIQHPSSQCTEQLYENWPFELHFRKVYKKDKSIILKRLHNMFLYKQHDIPSPWHKCKDLGDILTL